MAELWEQYYRLDPKIEQPLRDQLIASLRIIANAADGEGIELMRKGFALNGNKPITITELPATLGSNADQGTINLSVDQIESLRFGPQKQQPSLTGILVHEMYHKADPEFSKMHALLVAMGVENDPEMVRHVMTNAPQINLALTNRDPSLMPPAPNSANAAQYRELYANMKDAAAYIYLTLEEAEKQAARSEVLTALKDRLIRAGWYTADGANRMEDEATRYADAFMLRNGCDEPMRGEYYNNTERVTGNTLDLRVAQCTGPSDSPGFTPFSPAHVDPAELSNLQAPSIRPSGAGRTR